MCCSGQSIVAAGRNPIKVIKQLHLKSYEPPNDHVSSAVSTQKYRCNGDGPSLVHVALVWLRECDWASPGAAIA